MPFTIVRQKRDWDLLLLARRVWVNGLQGRKEAKAIILEKREKEKKKPRLEKVMLENNMTLRSGFSFN